MTINTTRTTIELCGTTSAGLARDVCLTMQKRTGLRWTHAPQKDQPCVHYLQRHRPHPLTCERTLARVIG